MPVDHADCHLSIASVQLLQLQTQLRPPPSLDRREKEPALESFDGFHFYYKTFLFFCIFPGKSYRRKYHRCLYFCMTSLVQTGNRIFDAEITQEVDLREGVQMKKRF